MKKLILLTLLIGFISCSDDDNSESNNPLIGEWKLISSIVDGVEELDNCDLNNTFLFSETNLTTKLYGYEDCIVESETTNTECYLSDSAEYSYIISNNTLIIKLIISKVYCDNPNGVDNTSEMGTEAESIPFSITNGELKLFGESSIATLIRN